MGIVVDDVGCKDEAILSVTITNSADLYGPDLEGDNKDKRTDNVGFPFDAAMASFAGMVA